MSIPYRWRQLANQWIFDIAGPLHISGTAVLLPFFQQDFGLPRTTVAWALVVYFLSTASFILAAAYLGNALGRRKLVLLGVSIDLASQVAVFFMAPFWGIVVLRAVGGIGNSMTVANLSPLTVASFPEGRRGQALGLMALGLGLGVLITPVVSGTTAETLGWRYLYLISASLYALLLVGAIFIVRESTTLSRERVTIWRFDYPGLVLVTGFLVSLTLGMQQLGAAGSAPLAVLLIALAAALALGFVTAEARSRYPLISLSLFRQRAFSSAVGRQFAFFMMRASYTFLLPFYLIQGLGWSGAFAGSVLIAISVGQPVAAPVSGFLSDRLGAGKLILLSFLAMVVGTLLLISLGSSPSILRVVVSLFLVGAAQGLFGPPNLKVIYDAIPREKLSLAPGVSALTGHGSNAIGSSLAAMLFGLFVAVETPVAFQRSTSILLAGFVAIMLLLTVALRERRPRWTDRPPVERPEAR